ncbi:MAG: metallophosphoesterase family protein [Anaerolineae bacterium]
MRVLVLTDVHSNYEALSAVLADAGSFDALWSLGDIVGYGPEPNACISLLCQHDHLAIAGNHDWAVLGKLDLAEFNADARKANLWTREQLTPDSLAYLQALPETCVAGTFTLAHGSPRHPIWEYLIYAHVAKANFAYFQTPVCLVGHTHVPVIFRDLPDSAQCEVLQPGESTPLPLGEQRHIINPGGVGQPRDGDPRAAYMILDTEAGTYEHRRVAYDMQTTQAKMREAQLPPRLVTRLEYGW